jgi:hypothetical protein
MELSHGQMMGQTEGKIHNILVGGEMKSLAPRIAKLIACF